MSADGFEFDKHFYSEGELFGSGPALYNIVVLVIKVVLWIIETLSVKRLQFHNKPQWYKPVDREVSDLTFKQMLTWYIEKDFTYVNHTSYKLAA